MLIKIKEKTIDISAGANTTVFNNIARNGSYEIDTMSFLMSFFDINPESVFINIGANKFLFPTVIDKIYSGSIEVYAMEPSPSHVLIGEKIKNSNSGTFTIIPNRLLKYSRASEPAQRRQAHFSQQLSVCWKSARKPACFQPYSTVFCPFCLHICPSRRICPRLRSRVRL